MGRVRRRIAIGIVGAAVTMLFGSTPTAHAGLARYDCKDVGDWLETNRYVVGVALTIVQQLVGDSAAALSGGGAIGLQGGVGPNAYRAGVELFGATVRVGGSPFGALNAGLHVFCLDWKLLDGPAPATGE